MQPDRGGGLTPTRFGMTHRLTPDARARPTDPSRSPAAGLTEQVMPNQQAQAQRKGITHVPTTDHCRHIRHYRHRSHIVRLDLPAELVHRVAALRFSDDHLELLAQLQFEFKLAIGNDDANKRWAAAAGVSTPSSAATYKPTCPGCHRGDYGPTAAHDCGVW